MITKLQVSTALRLNGISKESSRSEIKRTLTALKWADDEVEQGLWLLEHDPRDDVPPALLLSTDARFSETNISQLLNINITLQREKFEQMSERSIPKKKKGEFLETLLCCVCGLLICVVAGFILMYVAKIGYFAPGI